MGFTSLDGLVMATCVGSLDPGAVLWLATHAGLRSADVADALEHRSGLLGLAGTADMADVLRRSADGAGNASLAVSVYVHRLRAGIAAMAASAGGLDALVFSGGVGEHEPAVRQLACDGLAFLGVDVHAERNIHASPDCEITADGPVRTFVITAREDAEIARGVRATLGQ
jgi:acetate kinase